MNAPRSLLLLPLAALFLFCPAGWEAQARRTFVAEEEAHTTWLFWRRPAKNSPEEQLAHATRLERRGDLRRAARQYQRLPLFWPRSAEAPKAQLSYATLQHRRGKLENAFQGYQKLLERFPNHAPYEEVLERQFQIVEEMMERRYATFGIFPGFTRPKDAVEPLRTIVRNAPRWERSAEAQYLLGSIHEESGDYELAVVEYMNTMIRHPHSPFAESAAFARCRSLMQLAERGRYDLEQWQEAWFALNLFRATYPESEHTEAVQAFMQQAHRHMARAAFDVAVFYDENTRNQKAALVAYRSFAERFPNSEWTPRAQRRIEALSRKVEVLDAN